MNRIITALAIVFILLIVTGALFCWIYGDDYLYKFQMRGISPLEFIVNLYYQHDGRHLSPFGVIQMFMIKYLSAPPGILIYLAAYIVASLIIFKMIIRDVAMNMRFNITSFGIFTAGLLVGLWPLYKDVLYWLTGGAYMLALLQAVTLVYLFEVLKTRCSSVNNVRSILLGICVFVLALNTQNVMLPVLGWIAFRIYLKAQKANKWSLIIQFIMPVICAVLVTNLAPGNFKRITAEQSPLEFDALEVIETFIFIVGKFLRYSKWALLGGVLVGMYLSVEQAYHRHVSRSKMKLLGFRVLYFVILAVLSLMPFILVPDMARIRVYFFGMIFLFMAGYYLSFLFVRMLKQFNPIWRQVPLLCYLTFGLAFLIFQLSLMIPFSYKVAKRAKFLNGMRKSKEIVTYPRLVPPENLFVIRWADYERYGDWDRVADYYELRGYIELK